MTVKPTRSSSEPDLLSTCSDLHAYKHQRGCHGSDRLFATPLRLNTNSHRSAAHPVSMITHTSRADPIMSASPSSSRQPLSQQDTHHAQSIPSTSFSRSAQPYHDNSHPSPHLDRRRRRRQSQLQEQHIHFQLAVQHRALPHHPPSSHPQAFASASLRPSSTRSRQNLQTIRSSTRLLTTLYTGRQSLGGQMLFPTSGLPQPRPRLGFADRLEAHTFAQQSSSNDGQGLDEQSSVTFLPFYIMQRFVTKSKAGSADGDGTIGRNVVVSATGTYKRQSSASFDGENTSPYVLDEATLDSLYHALQAAFRHLSQRQVLSALQRTASIRWRAEAQLRKRFSSSSGRGKQWLVITMGSLRMARFGFGQGLQGSSEKSSCLQRLAKGLSLVSPHRLSCK